MTALEATRALGRWVFGGPFNMTTSDSFSLTIHLLTAAPLASPS